MFRLAKRGKSDDCVDPLIRIRLIRPNGKVVTITTLNLTYTGAKIFCTLYGSYALAYTRNNTHNITNLSDKLDTQLSSHITSCFFDHFEPGSFCILKIQMKAENKNSKGPLIFLKISFLSTGATYGVMNLSQMILYRKNVVTCDIIPLITLILSAVLLLSNILHKIFFLIQQLKKPKHQKVPNFLKDEEEFNNLKNQKLNASTFDLEPSDSSTGLRIELDTVLEYNKRAVEEVAFAELVKLDHGQTFALVGPELNYAIGKIVRGNHFVAAAEIKALKENLSRIRSRQINCPVQALKAWLHCHSAQTFNKNVYEDLQARVPCRVLLWLSYSPQLDLIENIWAVAKYEKYCREKK
ncbi:hypothetical protein G9A89_005654 [Geosiphon pyriformis]|nr:hypothetical protein G9A89_005654 [Geosiphon pyriformis]